MNAEQKKSWALFAIAGAVGFLVSLPLWYRAIGRPAISQPMIFNHQIHMKKDGNCTDCHDGAETGIHAGIPDLKTCSFCHDPPQGKSKVEAELQAYMRRKEEIPWQRLTSQPENTLFSHRLHVHVAKITCERCHDNMAESISLPKRTRQVWMADCIECHHDNNLNRGCNECHR